MRLGAGLLLICVAIAIMLAKPKESALQAYTRHMEECPICKVSDPDSHPICPEGFRLLQAAMKEWAASHRPSETGH